MKHETLSRAELYDLVWSKPLSTIAEKYNTSGAGLRKTCVNMNIPLPASGHWQKVLHGKTPRKIELPSDNSGPSEIKFEIFSPDEPRPLTVVEEIKKLQNQIELDMPDKLKVPDKLLKPEQLTVATRERHIASAKRDWSSPVYKKYPDFLDISASEKPFQRALIFFDIIVKLLRARGHEVYSQHHLTYIKVFGEKMEIRLREKNKIRRETKNNWNTSVYDPTGLLYFGVKASYQDKIWIDGKCSIELQLSHIVAYIEIKGKELEESSKRREIERKKEERKRQLRMEFEKKRDMELDKFKNFLTDVSRWHQMNLIRSYIDELERKNKNNHTLTSEIESWVDWARKKADWYDPQINAQDDLLEGIDKESLTAKKTSYW